MTGQTKINLLYLGKADLHSQSQKIPCGKVHLGSKRSYEFTNCDFATGTDFQVWSNITLDGCTVDGVAVTADNISTLFPNLNPEKVTIK